MAERIPDRAKHPSSENLPVRVALEKIRTALGTYSGYLFKQDVQKILELGDDSEDVKVLQQTARQYLENTRAGIPSSLIDWILAHRLPLAPKGFVSSHALSEEEKISFVTIGTLLQYLCEELQCPKAALEDLETYRTYQNILSPYVIFARSPVNGITTIFISPLGKQNLLRLHRENIEPRKASEGMPSEERSSPSDSRGTLPSKELEHRVSILPTMYTDEEYDPIHRQRLEEWLGKAKTLEVSPLSQQERTDLTMHIGFLSNPKTSEQQANKSAHFVKKLKDLIEQRGRDDE
jgi:hypothetical protein